MAGLYSFFSIGAVLPYIFTSNLSRVPIASVSKHEVLVFILVFVWSYFTIVVISISLMTNVVVGLSFYLFVTA